MPSHRSEILDFLSNFGLGDWKTRQKVDGRGPYQDSPNVGEDSQQSTSAESYRARMMSLTPNQSSNYRKLLKEDESIFL